MKYLLSIYFLLFVVGCAFCQDSAYTNILFYKKNKQIDANDKTLYLPKPTGFYFYKNCWYQMRLTKYRMFYGRILTIKDDSL